MAKQAPQVIDIVEGDHQEKLFFDGVEVFSGPLGGRGAGRYLASHIEGWPAAYSEGQERWSGEKLLTKFRRVKE